MANSQIQHQHVGVYGVLVKNESLLLVRKSRGPYTGLFDLPGGKIKHGESPAHTLVREIKEETGVIPRTWKLFDTFTFTKNYEQDGKIVSFHHLGIIYEVTEFDDAKFQGDICEEDVSGAHWDNLNEIDVMTPFAKRICREWRQRIFTAILTEHPQDVKKKSLFR